MKILVTSALPYADGDIHLGHLAGCYLPADIYTRYQRLKGRDVIHICGTDEHGVPVTLRAEAEGISPRALVDRYWRRIKESFEGFGIEFDHFSRTSRPRHHRLAQDFFLRLYKKGYIFEREITRLYCPRCRRFLPDRYVEGCCPCCGAEGARGDQCEVCGCWLEPERLLKPRCKICGGTPELRSTRHWFFSLDKLQPELERWIAEKSGWKENVLRFCEGWFASGLEPRAITRDLDWGVRVPLEGAKGKVLYVWFDAPIGYISATQEWAEVKGEPERWRDYWLDPETRLVHFIGKDNIVFHALIWPAMLMAHGDFILPSEIPANEFLNLEGERLSTSRNWAVWLPEYLKDFPPDPLRYALGVNLPENRDVDFTWRDFQARNNNELADILGNLVNRVIGFTQRYFKGKIPRATEYDLKAKELIVQIRETGSRVGELIEHFELKQGLRELMALCGLGNRYFDYERPWSTVQREPERCRCTIAACFKLIAALGTLLEPYLPFTAQKIRRMMSIPAQGWDEASEAPLPEELGPVEILFEKLPDERIAIEEARLGSKEEVMEITLEDFKRLDLRVARILKVEPVAGTSKLLRLQVDLGGEERQIVAGLREAYKPEELEGREIVLLANLKPVEIRGIESQGMLLAAVDGERISLVTLDREVRPGIKIS
jgi:methionyl-tRNA synthetase